MKIFTEKALEKYVDEKVQRIRDWDIHVREIDRLTVENHKLAERVEELERQVKEICKKAHENNEIIEAIKRTGSISVK